MSKELLRRHNPHSSLARRYTRLKQQSESTPFIKWNAALNKRVEEFSSLHHDITALVFSAYDTFTNVLSDPAAYGFDESEAHEAGGPIWFDHLHPTSAMHAIVAREVAEFLVALPPSNGEPFPSTAVQVGSQWAGLAKLKYLVILYASHRPRAHHIHNLIMPPAVRRTAT